MLESGNKHIYLTAGQSWSTNEQVQADCHLDVLEDSVLVLTCDWENNAGVQFANQTISLPAYRFDMKIKSITVTSGRVHIAKV